MGLQSPKIRALPNHVSLAQSSPGSLVIRRYQSVCQGKVTSTELCMDESFLLADSYNESR